MGLMNLRAMARNYRLFRLSRLAGVMVASCVSDKHRISVQLTRS
jgi:hypothetical protein